ncbi:hypothetical protein M9458_017903, partial [Cirrhinus mrigala]
RLEESIPASSQEQTLTKVEEEEADHKETVVEPQPKADMRDYLPARLQETLRVFRAQTGQNRLHVVSG